MLHSANRSDRDSPSLSFFLDSKRGCVRLTWSYVAFLRSWFSCSHFRLVCQRKSAITFVGTRNVGMGYPANHCALWSGSLDSSFSVWICATSKRGRKYCSDHVDALRPRLRDTRHTVSHGGQGCAHPEGRRSEVEFRGIDVRASAIRIVIKPM